MLESSLGCYNWRVLAQEIEATEDHASSSFAGTLVHDTVISKAHAESGKNAKATAAKRAVEALEGLAPFEFRELYGCNCTTVDKECIVDEEGGAAAEAEERGTAI